MSPARGTSQSDVTCALSTTDDGVQVRFTAEARSPSISDALAEILRGAGIRTTEANDLTLTFPYA